MAQIQIKKDVLPYIILKVFEEIEGKRILKMKE